MKFSLGIFVLFGYFHDRLAFAPYCNANVKMKQT